MAEELIPVCSTGSIGTQWVTRARLDEDLAKREAAREVAQASVREFAARLATYAEMDRVSERVLDLHSANDRFDCEGCSGYDTYWPCATVLMIARDYEIDIP